MFTNGKVKMKTIDAINQAIDNPSLFDKETAKIMGKMYQIKGISDKAKHREVNHDLILGAIRAMEIDPENGYDVYMAHLAADQLSNTLRDNLGTDNRDLIEIFLNRRLKAINAANKARSRTYKFQNKFMKKNNNKFENKMKRLEKKFEYD